MEATLKLDIVCLPGLWNMEYAMNVASIIKPKNMLNERKCTFKEERLLLLPRTRACDVYCNRAVLKLLFYKGFSVFQKHFHSKHVPRLERSSTTHPAQ